VIYIGNSALDAKANDELVAQLVGDIFSTKVIMHSDAYISLLGFTRGAPGALIISGTGSMTCAVDNDGNYHTSGGWGQILGDEGSGYHLGLMGIAAALRYHDRVSPPTVLIEKVKDFYALQHISEIIEMVYNRPVDKSIIASFAIEVEKAALEDDDVAIQLIDEEVAWLFKLSKSILRKSGVKRLGLYGSMLVKSKMIGQQLMSKYSGTDVEVTYPRFKPEIGALFDAFSKENIPITDEIIKNLSKY
jgi:N-acetylglucosamine kinase-like BadF-type ATPase